MNIRLAAVIPAAGKGERFDSSTCKQYYQIEQKTILEHTLHLFLEHPNIEPIIVPLATYDQYFSTLPCATHPKVIAVQGGSSRMESVLNALLYLKKKSGVEWVVVHDAVRPCLHFEDLDNLIHSALQEENGAILASPVQDTIKVGENLRIAHTLARDKLWHALTPQMFRFSLLEKALTHCQQNQLLVNDEASALEGEYPVKLVPARHPNPKLTYSFDLPYIRYLLKEKQHATNWSRL